VPANGETTVTLLSKLDMKVSLDPNNENNKIIPGQTVTVQPELIADDALFLRTCTIDKDGNSRSAEGNAEIMLLSPDGETISRGLTGFS